MQCYCVVVEKNNLAIVFKIKLISLKMRNMQYVHIAPTPFFTFSREYSLGL